MVTTRHRPETIWNRYNFPISMENCVLYAPLWQEDMKGTTFLSYDQNHHVLTPTGTTHGSQGRTFVAANGDDIALPASSVLQMGTGDWSAIVWYKPTTMPVQYPCPILFDNDGIGFVSGNQPGLLQDGDVVKGTTTTLTNGVWSCIGVSRTGTTYKCYFNGLDDSGTLSNAAWALSGKYYVGKGFSDQVVDGTVGEVWVYNRVLSDARFQQNYRSTRWTYK